MRPLAFGSAAAALALMCLSSPVRGQPISVFVGYADSLRPSPVNFPSPWFGSPFVIFEGCAPPSSCSYDAGAVMVTNNTGGPLTVNSVEIDIDTCAFNMWPSVSVSAGESLIVTQTTTGADSGCTANGHMDTSDIGPGGSGYAGNCNPDGIIPVVRVTVDGTTSTFLDSGQVLNTGGFDLASCPSGTNESTQWTAVGAAPCGGAVLTLAPASQTLPVGPVTLQVTTLTNCSGEPLANVQIDFAVLSGPNAGLTGAAVTDSNGLASLAYSSSVAGTDTIQASVTNPAGTFFSNTVTVTWQTSSCVGVVCTPLDQCHVATCDPATVTCSNQPAPDNTLCNNNACTQTATCQAGMCSCARLPMTTTSTTTTTTSTTTTTTPVIGFMTGGGNEPSTTGQMATLNGGTQRGVTQGLLLHCRAATLPNNLQVNSANATFHLQQLVSASCSNDGRSPQPPPAGFDVLQGSGTGRCNGLAATATFKFGDHGEPGRNDTVEIHITGGCSLDVSGNLQGGDIQAHNGH